MEDHILQSKTSPNLLRPVVIDWRFIPVVTDCKLRKRRKTVARKSPKGVKQRTGTAVDLRI